MGKISNEQIFSSKYKLPNIMRLNLFIVQDIMHFVSCKKLIGDYIIL